MSALTVRRIGSIVLLTVIFSLAASAAPAGEEGRRGLTVSLKFSGGAGFLFDGGGELEQTRLGRVHQYTGYNSIPAYAGSASWERLWIAPDYGFDLIFNFSDFIGIGIGSGYSQLKSRGEYQVTYDFATSNYLSTNYTYDDEYKYTRKYNIAATPATATLYLTIPMEIITVFAYAGAGYYMGSLTHDYTGNYIEITDTRPRTGTMTKEEITTAYVLTEKLKSNTLGVHGGLGADIRIFSFMALGLEVYGRYVNFLKWEGDVSWTQSARHRDWSESAGWYYDNTANTSNAYRGKLWYYEFYVSSLSGNYGQMFARESEPSSTSNINVREAAINMNNFGLRISLRLFFNLF